MTLSSAALHAFTKGTILKNIFSGSGKIILVILLVFTTPCVIYAQLVQSNRFEISLQKEEGQYNVVNADQNGIFLHRKLIGSGLDQIELYKLDTAFSVQWHGYMPIDKKHILLGSRTAETRMYLLFRATDPKEKSFQVYSVDQEDGQFLRYTVRNIISFTPIEFQVTGRAVLIGGYYNQVPVVIYFSFHDGRTKILPGLLNEPGELNQVKTNNDGTFDVVISAKNFLKQKTIWVKNYDAEGSLVRNIALNVEGNNHLIFGRSVKTDSDIQLIAGVYGGRQAEYSRGLFVAAIDPSGAQQVRYYGYGELENFFKYMKARREQRVKDRIERRTVRGKRIRLSYRFLVHEIVEYQDHFVMLGEAFYPQYIESNRGYYSGFVSPHALPRQNLYNGRIFDGYRYTHAAVMAFSRGGKLLWDNSFEINDIKTYTLEQFVRLEMKRDKIALLYLYDNQLRTKIIQDNKVLEGKSVEPIKTNSMKEVARGRSQQNNKLNYWYGDYFFASGVQDLSGSETGRRRVFFINKITYK